MSMDEKTLLIVDDEAIIHRGLDRTFRKESYRLLHAYDAAEAWAILESHPEVAGIICDHYMPGTTGLDLLREVRRRYPDLATVLLTAQADLQLVISAINEGHVHRFYTKPWSSAQLREELRVLLRGAGEVGGRDAQGKTLEERIREELLPMQDAETGAFILQDPNA